MFGLAYLVHALHGVFREAGTCYACWFGLGEMEHKHNFHFGWHTQWVSHSKTPGRVRFCCESCCPMLGVWNKYNSQVMEVYLLFVGFVTQLCRPSNVRMSGAWTTHCVHAYKKLTFHLHHAWHSCLVFTALWCGCSVVKLTYLHQAPS